MRTEQNQLGLVEGADDQLYRETSPLNPPAGARSGPAANAVSHQLDELCAGFWSAAQTG